MDIGIIGSGNIGGTLARRLVALGHRVTIANSRGPASLTALAAESGAHAVTVEEAARARDVVIVTIPQKAIAELPAALFATSSAILIDTGNYYPSRDGRITALEDGLTESVWVAQKLGRPVIKAFNNIVATSLASRGGTGVCLSVAGDDAAAKKTVRSLVESLGFDTLDAGSLADSWRQQPGTPSYCHDLDVAALTKALAAADASKKADYRARADEAARPYFVR